MEFFSALADFLRPLWGLWLMLFFAAIIAFVMWPSKKRKQNFEDHAQIPFKD
ncbi:cbb3-type cytochrome c oxidase subunit 3 [Thalassospira marina]|uniref:CcoQ/FixQ family Cbb3-type cytochrome c oxidase assembly chaperone n=1 Tax=Thalassospira marina TaxID=2048283 RepID=A0A2N3KD17_9PROT|nr:cbb3-type cytochrome c oxidase subunit 3 [Thalassospira marina]AUG51645.1 CcoQ/FixQ family Cbb3-type cytochrome c oxidase assembly chaperone [Thalassospira marina]PKR48469.1 CcoQ/FixQ family Cbb3-type cytochrome c oxidase assembly chaperone [Thalassospira marina]